MNHYVNDYLKHVLDQVKYRKYHPYLAQELNDHIECLKEDYMEEGMGEEEAYQKAVQEMGDPDDLGRKMHQLHKPRIEWRIFLLVAAFLAFNLFLLSEIDMAEMFGQSESYVRKQIILIVAGMVVFVIAYFMDYHWLIKLRFVILGIAITLMVLTHMFGIHINGKTKWLRFGSLFVPSIAIATPMIIIALACCIHQRSKNKIMQSIGLFTMTVVTIGMMLVMDFWQAGILAVSVWIMFYCATYKQPFYANKKVMRIILWSGLGASILLGAALIFFSGYRMERVEAFISPCGETYGYLYIQLFKVLKQATLTGNAFADASLGTWLSSNLLSDFTLTYIIGRFGILAACCLGFLMMALIRRLFRSAHRYKESFGSILMYGIGAYFTVQFVAGSLINLNLMPYTSCPLPFISYNGMLLILNMELLGLFLGIYRRKDIIPEQCIHTSI